MEIKEVYEKFQTPQNLQEHMLRVGALADILTHNWIGENINKTAIVQAGLIHDIAKPMTKSIDDTGRARFLGHTKQGAAITANILERLRFSNREIRLVESLVYHHLRPVQMANEEFPTQRAIYR